MITKERLKKIKRRLKKHELNKARKEFDAKLEIQRVTLEDSNAKSQLEQKKATESFHDSNQNYIKQLINNHNVEIEKIKNEYRKKTKEKDNEILELARERQKLKEQGIKNAVMSKSMIALVNEYDSDFMRASQLLLKLTDKAIRARKLEKLVEIENKKQLAKGRIK